MERFGKVRRHHANFKQWLGSLPWKRIGLWGGGALVVLLLLAQIFYPGDRLPLFSRIDGVSVGWSTKSDAVTKLNTTYAKYPVAIYMTGDARAVTSPKLADLDVSVDNETRVSQLDYPWYLRIIPTSLFWAGFRGVDAPKPSFGSKFQAYVDDKLMANCHQAPVDATLKADGGKLVVVDEKDGRSCEKNDVVASIKKIQPDLTKETSVHVGAEIQPATVTTNEAKVVAEQLNERITDGVAL